MIGGTSLLGGTGGAIGSIFGAFVLRTISFNFRIFDVDPLLQPLFEGIVLLAAVSLGAAPGPAASRTGSNFSDERHDRSRTGCTALRLAATTSPILIAGGFILVILAVGTAYTLTTQGTATLPAAATTCCSSSRSAPSSASSRPA